MLQSSTGRVVDPRTVDLLLRERTLATLAGGEGEERVDNSLKVFRETRFV